MKGLSIYLSHIKSVWVQCWESRFFRIHLGLTILGFLAFLRWGIECISQFELRHGRVLADPILENLSPRDFSAFIFGLLHTGIIITALRLLSNPIKLVKGMQACLILLLMRTISIYLVPLEPPPGMIMLEDPFLTWVFGSATHVAVKDLFFSGHIATMFVLIYYSETGYWRTYITAATMVVAVLIAWQHVHYSIDLIAAPIFGFFCCRALDKVHARSEYGLEYNTYELGYEEAR
jgi:hypothetical protein